MEVDGRMHIGDAKIAYLIKEHLQTEKKNQNKKKMVRATSKKRKGEEEGVASRSDFSF
jgi:hypothetical protein